MDLAEFHREIKHAAADLKIHLHLKFSVSNKQIFKKR